MRFLIEVLIFSLLVGLTNAQGRLQSETRLDQYKGSSLSYDAEGKLQARQKLSPSDNKNEEGRDLYDAGYVDDATAEELCAEYLLSFLGGTTDAKDNCDGIQNAYEGAKCSSVSDTSSSNNYGDDDDFFSKYNQPTCCQSLKNHYHDYCGDNDFITNAYLLITVSVLLLCEGAKSLIKKYKLYFLPEAGGCILVGASIGMVAHVLPFFSLDDVSFDQKFFLMVLLPPIIFEASLSVNKKEFRRRRLAILLFAILGTILSTFMTAFIVYYASAFFNRALPMLDCLIFGALISSIDPVAILSVLTNLNLTEEDAVFILVFGESLLNDGIAITLFNTVVSQYNKDQFGIDDILGGCADFLIVCFGSVFIGVICGFGCLIYFWLLRKLLSSAMEVASFFLWAMVPYYICDIVGLNGIIGIVTMGFFMDIYIAARKDCPVVATVDQSLERDSSGSSDGNYIDIDSIIPNSCTELPRDVSQNTAAYSQSLRPLSLKQLIVREEAFRLTAEADKHVKFVAHFISQLAENVIFVYLGLFMFSNQYEWSAALVLISIVSCVLSRAVMVVIICMLVWYINVLRLRLGYIKPRIDQNYPEVSVKPQVSRTAIALQDRKIQLVLVLAGLRGAVSLALVESVPLYNAVTGEGSMYKPELKAMTSASILFTLFVFGGSAYYILGHLNIPSDTPSPTVNKSPPVAEDSKCAPIPESAYV